MDLFETIPENGAEDDYKTAKENLTAHFEPQKNIELEKFRFRQAKRKYRTWP